MQIVKQAKIDNHSRSDATPSRQVLAATGATLLGIALTLGAAAPDAHAARLAMIGNDFAAGLANLKTIAEQ